MVPLHGSKVAGDFYPGNGIFLERSFTRGRGFSVGEFSRRGKFREEENSPERKNSKEGTLRMGVFRGGTFRGEFSGEEFS